MASYQLKDGVHSVGVMNPNLRVFDIIMRTEYGTSYNAYLIQGTEKTALVETVHARFFDEYISNIEQVMDPAKIDYIILNHTEPDHSGSLRALKEKCPNLQVVASMAGAKYLQGITNMELGATVVRDGDSIDLGGKTLKFTAAPFLHWPDSMFTYLEEDKILFSCDMFGCHYCEPRVLDLYVSYPDSYEVALKYYFDAIFGPFRPYVIAGMNKIKDLPVDMICTSHGPVLTEYSIEKVTCQYREWSEPRENGQKTAAVFYVSAYGCTRSLAEEAYQYAKDAGFDTHIYNIIECDPCEVAAAANEADILLFGSPTINRDALKPVWDTISGIDAINCKGKPAAVFGSYGWSGEAVGMLCERLSALKLKVYEKGFRANFVPSAEERDNFAEFIKGFLAQV